MERESPPPRGDRRTPRRRRPVETADVLLTVLVADDEALIRRALDRLLTGRGHTVLTADDAPSAITLLGEHRFDVALVDRNMPGGGSSVLAEIARYPDRAARTILMTGAIGAETTTEIGRDVKLVRKPFDFSAMVREVEEGPG